MRRILVVAMVLLASCARPTGDESELRRLVGYLDRSLARVRAASFENQWQAHTTGAAAGRPSVPGGDLLFLNLQRLEEWRGRTDDPILNRRVELFYRHALAAQEAADSSIQDLVTDLFELDRARRTAADRNATELARVARLHPDRERREDAWRRLHVEPGAAAVATTAELFRKRSRLARRLGFDDYFQLGLEMEGARGSEVENLIEALESQTREAARRTALQLAARTPDRRVRPWDLEHSLEPYLSSVEPFLAAASLQQRTTETFAACGLPVEGVTIATALGPGSRFLAFPIAVPDDVRVLLRPGRGFYNYRGCFHELGHAAYYRRSSAELLVERLPPNGSFSEGFAKLFERLPYRPGWLERYASVPAEIAAGSPSFVAADELFRVRRFLVGFAFEKQAYADPEQDLSQLYRELASEIAFVDYRDIAESWAADQHLATQPLSNLQYLLARLIQAQLDEALEARFDSIIDNPAAGAFIEREIIAPGATLPWHEIVRRVTGKPLGIDAYLERELRLDTGS